MVPLVAHRNTIRELRERWAQELTFKRFCWEEVHKELKELKKFKSMQKEKDQVYNLSQELMISIPPYPSYPVFMYEQFTWFKLKALKERRPYEVASSAHFLDTFMERKFTKNNLLCEIYFHEMACPLDHHSNPTPYLGDVQLRAFATFVSNHVQWEDSF